MAPPFRPGDAPRLVVQYGHFVTPVSLRWSPDGKRLITASDHSVALIRDVENGWVLSRLSGVIAIPSPDGRYVATVSPSEERVVIWEADRGRRLRSFKNYRVASEEVLLVWSPHGGRVAFGLLVWSPDSTRVAFVAQKTAVVVYDVQSGQRLQRLQAHPRGVMALAWSPADDLLATGGMDGWVKLWDARRGRLLQTLTKHRRAAELVVFSPDGRRLATGARQLRVWDLRRRAVAAKGWRGRLRYASGISTELTSITWDPQGWRLAFQDHDRSSFKLLHLDPLRLRTYPKDGYMPGWSADGRYLARFTFRQLIVSRTAPNASRILHDFESGISSGMFQWSPRGTRLAGAIKGGQVVVWQAATGKKIRTFPAPKSYFRHALKFAVSPNGRLLAATRVRTQLWELATGRRLATLEGDHLVGFSPDSTRLAIQPDMCTTVKVWDIPRRRWLSSFKFSSVGCRHQGSTIRFSPDGKHLAATMIGARELAIWDAERGHLLVRIKSPKQLTEVRWSPDGGRVLASSPTIRGGRVFQG